MQKIVDFVVVDGSRALLDLMSVAMLAILGFQAAIGWLKARLTVETGQRIDAQLVLGYYRHLLALPQRFFDTMRVGEILSRVGDAVKIRAFVNEVALELAVSALVVAASLALLLAYSWRLALLAAAAVPVYATIYAVTNRLNRAGQRALMESGAEFEAQVAEALGGVSTLRCLGVEVDALARAEARFVRVLRAVRASAGTAIASGAAAQLVARASTVLLLWAGAALVLEGRLTPGELMSCYAIAGYLAGPVLALVAANRTLQDALIAADRLFEILDLELEPRDGAPLTPEMAGSIRLRGVCFRYGGRARVLDGVDLEVERGRITALVGESGSGKSTIAALLHRLHPLEGGRIEIGGYDIAHLSPASLRRVIGIVPQRVDLFAGDVVHNVALGDAEPDLRRVMDVCRLVGIDEVVQRLPAGLRTPLGERGALLSGGERQRLALARALYRDPPVLVLDEATAALDPLSERAVARVLLSLRDAGRTLLVIAHRLASVAHADRIVVLAGGRVAEEGTHAELLARGGSYARLWEGQFGSPPLPLAPAGA